MGETIYKTPFHIYGLKAWVKFIQENKWRVYLRVYGKHIKIQDYQKKIQAEAHANQLNQALEHPTIPYLNV